MSKYKPEQKRLPGQRDGETLSAHIQRTWDENEDGLQAEFGFDFETYAAFCKADAIGVVRILRGRSI